MQEKIANIHASVPEAIQVEVMLKLNRLAGEITTVEWEADSRTVIGAAIPKKQVADFKIWLQSYSAGRGSVSEGEI